jgi:AcrR family transcriptional regulator
MWSALSKLWHTGAMTSTAGGVRARARVALVAAIKDAARRQVAAEGAPALSLRAVARELGMVSSALYRYFPSRDDLLTALIIDGYDDLGAAAEAAAAAARDEPVLTRWRAVCQAIRDWATGHPHEYALLYGSPVPGYRAPQETVAHAARVAIVLGEVLRDGVPSQAATSERDEDAGAIGLDPGIRSGVLAGLADDVIARGLLVWSQLFGLISFELYGHFVGSVADYDAFFADAVDRMAEFVGMSRRATMEGRGDEARESRG